MKLQDLHPFDTAILGLNNIYTTVGSDSFFINSPCILARDHIISTGYTYLLIWSTNKADIELRTIRLLDVLYLIDTISFFVKDVETNEVFSMVLDIDYSKQQCNLLLMDFHHLLEIIDSEILRTYDKKA